MSRAETGAQLAGLKGLSLDKDGYLLRSLMEHLPDRIYFKDLQSRIVFGNQAYAKLFNKETLTDLYGKTDFDFFSGYHAQAAYDNEQEIIRTGRAIVNIEEMETWPDNRITWCSTSKAPLRDDQGNIVGTLGISRDITAQKVALFALQESETKYRMVSEDLVKANRQLMEVARTAEEARDSLAQALAEKDVLLKEVHHRVKNSLQIIRSIISLHARRAKDPVTLATYHSILDRIVAIGSAHNRLFDLDSEKKIDLPDYIGELIRHFNESYSESGAEFHLDAEPIFIPLDLCLDLGLILTELVLNAYQYAVVPTGKGTIRITVRREPGTLVLTVADDGPGFPEGFNPVDGGTIGFGIIHSMIKQRGGTLAVASDHRAVVHVRLPFASV